MHATPSQPPPVLKVTASGEGGREPHAVGLVSVVRESWKQHLCSAEQGQGEERTKSPGQSAG